MSSHMQGMGDMAGMGDSMGMGGSGGSDGKEGGGGGSGSVTRLPVYPKPPVANITVPLDKASGVGLSNSSGG